MFFENITERLKKAIDKIVEDKAKYVTQKGAFTRNRKFGLIAVLLFCITKGAKSTGNEIEEFHRWSEDCPTEPGVLEQRMKLKAEAFTALLRDFGMALLMLFGPPEKYLLTADGTGASFLKPLAKADAAWRNVVNGVVVGHAHVTMLYDVASHIFLDAVIQSVHALDERRAFEIMIDRFVSPWKTLPVIFTADRGFPSWNVAAHVIENGHYFLIRAKDVTVQGSQLAQLVPVLPTSGRFDMWVNVRIVRKQRDATGYDPKTNTIAIYVRDGFDYTDAGSEQVYKLKIRACRFKLQDGSYECVLTNLPKRFTPTKLAKMYWLRWGIEGAIGRCKGPLALEAVSSRKPELVMQDILGTLIAYNVVAAVAHYASIRLAEERAASMKNLKHEQAVDFSHLVGPCRQILLHPDEWNEEKLLSVVRRHTHCKRPKRPAPPRGTPRRRGVVPLVGRAS